VFVKLAPSHSCDSFSKGKESLWSGSKGVTCKKHRPSYFGLRISNFGFFGFSFSIRIPQSAFRNLVAGLSGDPPDRPYADSTRGRGSGAVPARPKKWNAPHGFSAQRPCFLAGQPLKFNPSFTRLAKSKVGKIFGKSRGGRRRTLARKKREALKEKPLGKRLFLLLVPKAGLEPA
jgi:hypothetical protein